MTRGKNMKKRILSLFVIFLIFTSCNGKEQSNEVIQENKSTKGMILNENKNNKAI